MSYFFDLSLRFPGFSLRFFGPLFFIIKYNETNARVLACLRDIGRISRNILCCLGADPALGSIDIRFASG